MAKIPTRQRIETGAPIYLKRLTGWRYWWARLRGKPTTIGVPASQVKIDFVGALSDIETMIRNLEADESELARQKRAIRQK